MYYGDSLLRKFLKSIIAPYIIKKYNIKVIGKIPKPPFLFIANHTHILDGFFIQSVIPYPISFVMAGGTYYNKWVYPFFKHFKFIPKQKGVPDIKTVRDIFKVLKNGGIVGLFPEGSTTWSGNYQPVPSGTDKLLDKIKVPILAARIHGGYLSKPRWAKKERKGNIIIELKTFNDSAALEYIKYNEWDWQEKNKWKYSGNKKAEGLERIIWFCDKCNSFNSIKAKGNVAKCTNCSREYAVDDYGYINGKRIDNIIYTQKEKLINYMNNNKYMVLDIGTLEERDLFKPKLLNKEKGNIEVFDYGIKFNKNIFEFKKIKNGVCFVSTIFEFIYEEKVYRIKSENYSYLLYNIYKIRSGKNVHIDG
ncbi:lysophospholipid acyltransferase family protein [Marinitoga aeolica]|uniref:1-acyl-sn-glycerol-3-phosphate acyltransferase n=1 Tax=Marinitoga aeolica TaxID=2809031 RepID=A0ABY8PSF2_9BACT|nr:lysophospholipid acyltransferase family protein [Marinitoga aeolica]WGS65569.1 1-acyl-sn-glycerol-3-phosphate acyltransferase [Marinitoga aeolica]